MFNISSNGIITMNRGDFKKVPLFINAGDKLHPLRYVLTEDDIVCVYISEPNQLIEDSIIQKTYTKKDLNEQGDVVIKFGSNDTFYLVPGNYYYEIKLVCDKVIKTIVPKRKFIIVE